MTIKRGFAAALFSVAALATPTLAQDFPSETITIVVPFNAGGGTDTLARIIQPGLEASWGQTVVIENRPGASGLVGALAFLRDGSDGHEILMASTGSILSLAREGEGMRDGSFHIEDVLKPISQVAQPPYIVTVHPDMGVSTLAELIEYAAANPGEVTFGSSGVGAASHLTGVLFQELAGVEMNHVPYNGMGEAGPALLGGEIDLLFAPAPVVQASFDDGSLIPLAVTTGEPSSLFPDLPTVSEELEGFSIAGWFGLFGHPNASDERIDVLSTTVRDVLGREDVAERMAGRGGEPRPMTPAEYQAFVNTDVETWQELQAIVDGG